MPDKNNDKVLDMLLNSKSMELRNKIKKEIGALEEDFVHMFLLNEFNLTDAGTELIRLLAHENKIPGVYIAGSKPFPTIMKHLKRNKVDAKDIFFIDCISSIHNVNETEGDQFHLIGSLKELTALEISLEKTLANSPSNEIFIILDSISTLLIYHDEKTIERFIHGITTRIREKPGRKGFLIAVNAVDTEPILTKMAQFCDKVVKIE